MKATLGVLAFQMECPQDNLEAMPDRIFTHTPVVAGIIDNKVRRDHKHGTF